MCVRRKPDAGRASASDDCSDSSELWSYFQVSWVSGANVPLREARSIDDLYSSVADYDLVLTAEAPLALALDNRVQTPRLGRLSATPRSYAAGEMFPNDIRPLFFDVIERTDLSWKQAVRALQLAIDCWTVTGDREGILGYPEFDTPAVRATVGLLGELESSYRIADGLTIPTDLDVAVIDDQQLSELDRSLLPSSGEYDTYESLADTQTAFPELRVFPSATSIVQTIVEQIDPETADQFGIVLVEGSLYSALIESALEAREIPYSGGPGFDADEHVRGLLRLVEMTFAGSNQRVSEIRPVLTTAGISMPRDVDARRVDSLDSTELGAYGEFQETVATGTFRDVVAQYESTAGVHLTELRRELDALGLLDKHVTEDRVTRFQYYLDAFTVPTDTGDQDGVLLAGANSTAYVDRPVVFYVGLGPEWAQAPPDYPWIDPDAFLEADVARFERLLQNGEQRYYFVQETHGGDDITPCVYLRRLLDDSFETFDDLLHTRDTGHTAETPAAPFEAPTMDAAPKPVTTVSQSRLKSLANAPRDAYFDRLVESPDSLPLVRGTVLHEAAEIHACDPSVLDPRREDVLDAMCDRLDPYLGDSQRSVHRTRLDVGLDAIVAFLEVNPSASVSHDTYDFRDRENKLATELGIEIDSPLTERWFASETVGVHGYIDLLQNETSVVDYKTGRKKDAGDILDAAAIDPVNEYPDFQALVYLAKHREERPNHRLDIHFVHLLHDVEKALAGTPPDPADLVTTITYVPSTFSEFVASRETFETVTDYADSNNRCKALGKLGYEAYREFFQATELPRAGEDPERRERVTERFVEYVQERVGEYKYVQDGCEKVISDLTDVPTGYVLKSDLDAFEVFVDDQLTAVNEYRASRFPVAYRDDGPTWDRVDYRDCILTDR